MTPIMYHYIRDKSCDYPNFHSLSKDIFVKQIKYFIKNKGIGSPEDFFKCVNQQKIIDKYFLTFDDGFKEHIDFVANVLDDFKIQGFFYPSTLPLELSKILDVHKVHLLIGKYDTKILIKEALDLIDTKMLDEDKIFNFDKEIYKDQILDESEKKYKRLFNYYLKPEFRTSILQEIFCDKFNEAHEFKKLYMNLQDLSELVKSGHHVGSHSHSHTVMSKMCASAQKQDILLSKKNLKNLPHQQFKSFCYPYGGHNSFNAETIKLLQENDFDFSFMVGNVNITTRSIKYVYNLTRIDCNRYMNV